MFSCRQSSQGKWYEIRGELEGKALFAHAQSAQEFHQCNVRERAQGRLYEVISSNRLTWVSGIGH